MKKYNFEFSLINGQKIYTSELDSDLASWYDIYNTNNEWLYICDKDGIMHLVRKGQIVEIKEVKGK